MRCAICNQECKGLQALSNHLGLSHQITGKDKKQQYYDQYMKKENEEICPKCGKLNHFQNLTRGYTNYCCKSCQVSAQGNGSNIDHDAMWVIKKENIQKFEQENNCTHLYSIVTQYGRLVRDAIKKLQIPVIRQSKMYQYIDNDYIPEIKHFVENYNRTSGTSGQEKYLRDRIKYNGTILHNTKKIIYPYELDIYIPDLKLAIEYNGIYYHSTIHGTTPEYHLNKSMLCRKKGIRLVHIYEFENLDEQIDKINQLIKGIDTYNTKDFNKNNLTRRRPKPYIIYNDGRCVIYGAGKLYK